MSDPETGTRLVRMAVTGLGLDPSGGATVLLLESDDDSLAMAIGLGEATSIAKALRQLEVPRPLAHDLLRDVIADLGGRLRQIEVIELRDNTYFAELVLVDASGQERRVDSRPSDAIALALRVDAPILVHEHVLGKARRETQEIPSPADKEGWKKLLQQMEPDDFGKYKM